MMLKQIKQKLNIPLVETYKTKDGQYSIDKQIHKFIDSARLFKTVKEMNKYLPSTIIHFYKIKISPVHLILLARGLRNRSKSEVDINYCECSSNSIFRLRNFIGQLPKVTTRVSLKTVEKWLGVLHLLSSLSDWKSKNISIDVYKTWSLNKFLEYRFGEKNLHQKLLNLCAKNDDKISCLLLNERLNYKYFRTITYFYKQFNRAKNEERLHGNGNVIIKLHQR